MLYDIARQTMSGRRGVDFQREAEEFEARKRMREMQMQQQQVLGPLQQQKAQLELDKLQREIDSGISSTAPAPLRLAQEVLAAEKAGDFKKANAIREFAKTQEKGLVYNPSTGTFVPAAGVPSALGQLQYGKQVGTERAKTEFEPQRAGMIEQEKLQQQLSVRPEIARGEAIARELGAKEATLRSIQSKLPELQRTVEKLSDLGQTATYTLGGQVLDIVRREAGMDVGEGAIARKEYMSIVDNQILPLLRDTFGAQFTEREGEALRKTLGDVNASPAEKDAVLRSFINQKVQTVESLRREVGQIGRLTLEQESRGRFEANKQKTINFEDLPE